MKYSIPGEMFDYIIKKERLSESEARHFFRQLVQVKLLGYKMSNWHIFRQWLTYIQWDSLIAI
jgi:hypothetical protein